MYVYKNGQVARSRIIVVRYITNKYRKTPRLAVVVSKKTYKSAVRRNRIRRRIYEYVRTKLTELNAVYDIVIIVSSGELLTMQHKDIAQQIDQLFNQAGILK